MTLKLSELSAAQAIAGRRSVRRFLPTPVDDAVICSILTAASRAASGVNMQPWRVHVVTGEARANLSKAARQADEAGETSLEYPYLPEELPEPYRSRRRALGYALYAIQGIDKSDYPARRAAMLRNYDFFGAPVGLFITMDRVMTMGAWLDCGMFMQNIMLMARAYGLETCPQQSWCDQGAVVHKALGIPPDFILLSGMALGHADPSAPENKLISERVPLADFASWHR